MKEILRCICHVCKNKFSLEQGKGRICDNCGEPACNRHLSGHDVRGKTMYICSKCLKRSMGV